MVVCRWRHGSSGNVQNERLSVIDPSSTVHPTREARVVRVKGGEGGRGTASETSVVLPPFSLVSYYIATTVNY